MDTAARMTRVRAAAKNAFTEPPSTAPPLNFFKKQKYFEAGRYEHALYNGAALHNSTWCTLFLAIGTGTSSAHVIW